MAHSEALIMAPGRFVMMPKSPVAYHHPPNPLYIAARIIPYQFLAVVACALVFEGQK